MRGVRRLNSKYGTERSPIPKSRRLSNLSYPHRSRFSFFSSRSCTRVFDRITAHVSLVSNQGWIKRSSLFLSLRFVFIPILQFSSFAIRTRIFEHAVANPRISFLKLKFPFSRTVKICSWYESSNHHRMEKRRLLLKKYRISRYRACARWIRRLFNKSCRHGSARNFACLNSAR